MAKTVNLYTKQLDFHPVFRSTAELMIKSD